MKWFLLVTTLAILTAGCSENQISIANQSKGTVHFLFRGEKIDVFMNTDTTIKAIPNGTFTYGTTYEIPNGVQSTSADAQAAGNLTFQQGKTKVSVFYSWFETYDSTGQIASYKLNCQVSDNNNLATPTSP